MELEHTFTVPVPARDAFTVLRDIRRIGPCLPGATVEEVDGDHFTGKVKVKVGPMQVTYRGEADYTDIDEDALSAAIVAKASEARGSGTARATIRAKLVEQGDVTEVRVTTDLAITGRPAQFGRGVMAEVGEKLLGQFADCLAAELASGPAAPAAAEGDAEAELTGSPPGAPTEAVAAGADALAEAAPPLGTSTAPTPERRTDDTIDLLDVAGAPVAKRLAPVAVGALVVLLLVWLVRRRR